MTLTRILLASTAISLSSIGFSHAAPFSQMRSLSPSEPAVTQYLKKVQLSVDDAEAQLAAALARKAEADASGGDVATAQAEVEAAQAELAAAQAAVQGEAAPAAETPAAPEPAAEPAAEPETAPEAEAIPEPAPEPEPAVEPETAPEPAPEAEPTPEPAPEAAPAPVVEPEVVPEPAAEPTAEQPAAEDPAVVSEPAPEAEPAPETAPVAEPEAAAEPAPEPSAEPAVEEPAAEAPAPEAEPAPKAAPEAPAPAAEPAAEPAPEAPATDAAAEQPAADSSQATQPAADTAAPAAIEEEVLTLPVEDGAPVLDSAKEESATGADAQAPAAAPASTEPAAPPPTSDGEAQAPAMRSEAAPQVLAEEGERISEAPAPTTETNVTIINQTDNRTIIEVDNRTIIEHDERERLQAGSEEVYYERLGGGRVREVIVRPNGVQLVTITNRWGDIVQRSRIMPDGREYVLFYANANSDGSRQAFVDPGRNMPRLRLQIPIGEYILDATVAEPSAYLEFLMEPPVEQVERLYTVEEVRRSARIRDKVRRIDLDSLTFEFGKATIAEDQIQRLSDVAAAMSKILERNPAETFLIEGHTDAVGTDNANLLLSDQRSETIAVALTDVFGIPPENLVTQGYGERYLKVTTQAPERLNRRVTIRRITPLVTPVASR